MVLVSSQYVAEDCLLMKGDIGGSVSTEQSPDCLAHLLGRYIIWNNMIFEFKWTSAKSFLEILNRKNTKEEKQRIKDLLKLWDNLRWK